MNLSNVRSKFPQFVLSFLPFTFFFPVGVVYFGVLLFLLGLIASGDYRGKILTVRENPLFFPVLGLSAVSSFAALFLERPAGEFWSGYAHYQIYLFLLLFISVGKGDWQRRAVTVFLAGAVYAATLFYMNQLSLLPAVQPFNSYIVYSGNKSILLGILLGIAGGRMVYELTTMQERRWLWLRIAALLYVVIALIFFAKTRTGSLIFGLLCMMVLLKHMTFSWRSTGWLLGVALIIFISWQSASGLRSRVMSTVSDIQVFMHGGQVSGEGIRLEMYRVTAQIIAEKPLTGHGIATWLSEYQTRVKGTQIAEHTTPHNDYLLYSTEIGLIGLAALLWIWITQLLVAWRIGGDHGMLLGMLGVAVMIAGMFNAVLRDALFGMPFMILLAIPLAGVTIPSNRHNNGSSNEEYLSPAVGVYQGISWPHHSGCGRYDRHGADRTDASCNHETTAG